MAIAFLGLKLAHVGFTFVGHLTQDAGSIFVVDHVGEAAALCHPGSHLLDQFGRHAA